MAIISPVLLLLLSGYIVSSDIGTTKDIKHTDFLHIILRGKTRIGLKHMYNEDCDTIQW